jgi:hypothetical protein
MESHRATIDRIAPSTEELREKAEKMGYLRLTEKEVKDICLQLNQELIELDILKRTFIFSSIFILAFTIFGLYKFILNVTRFDGLSLLVIALLFFGFHWLVYEFSGVYYGGHSASMDIRILIFFGSFIIPPFLFYTAYRLNKIELNLHLHKQKWISYMAVALTILSLLLALIVGIGVLIIPDVSSFKN